MTTVLRNPSVSTRFCKRQASTPLVGELHHRMKNLLATVSAIVVQSLRTAQTLAEGQAAIQGRIAALGRVQDLLLQANWRSANLSDILRTAIQPFEGAENGNFMVQATDIEAAASAALPLAMAIHELCTNAVKYGALSAQFGKIEIIATIENDSFAWSGRKAEVRPSSRRLAKGLGPASFSRAS